MRFLLTILLLLSTSCKFQADTGFLNDAQANYHSQRIHINGQECLDMNNIDALCSKRVADNQPLKFHLEPRPYSYRLNFVCSKTIDYSLSINVPEYTAYDWQIDPEKYNEISFTCIGELFPQDRNVAVSNKFEVRVKVYDHNYVRGDDLNFKDGKVYVGQYAKHTMICDDNGCKHYKEKPIIKLKTKGRVLINTETEIMRSRYFRYDDLD